MNLDTDTGQTRRTEAPRFLTTLRRFVRSTRAGATAITAAAVTVMTVGGAALVIDHAWLVDQRDVLKSAADAAGIAATLEMNRQIDKDPAVSDADLQTMLEAVAERYVVLNLQHLPQDRLAKAVSTLAVAVVLHRAPDTVDVSAEADLGGTLVSQHLPLFASTDTLSRVRVVSQGGENRQPRRGGAGNRRQRVDVALAQR